ncbi:hypothetical protein KV205_17340 [Streptomyces sp. SKN60]|uniref:hypothetical protein n=1 Tax=Streptomyces sp. SKN60 TaxID=2855506 RepID=UPI002245564B|nr:hypothetical protein [Streptomyces sp. SKN60]MCX2182280.1 hypothetical protein [Streptomyces sp. SKN60]
MPQHEEHDVTNGRFEDELGTVMRHAGEGFALDDRRELVTGGLARGRRRVVRRRVATVGGALALAAIGVGGVYGGSVLGGNGGVEKSSVAGPTQGGTNAQDKAAEDEATLGARIPALKMLAVLKNNLPAGAWTVDNPKSAGTGVHGTYDDGKGKARVSASLTRTAPEQISETSCQGKGLETWEYCNISKGKDGSLLLDLRSNGSADAPGQMWKAISIDRYGFTVIVSESTTPKAQGQPPLPRKSLPFTAQQLKQVATLGDWAALAKSYPLPKSGKPGAAALHAEPSGPVVKATLRSLLPKGLTVVDRSEQAGYSSVVVDDGKGRSLVGVNVQYGMNDVRGQLFGSGDVTTLPDGRVVKLTQQPGEKGGAGVVWWTADTMTKDGFRVVVSAFNTGDQAKPATRPEPALTLEQLKAIALDPRWQKLPTK